MQGSYPKWLFAKKKDGEGFESKEVHNAAEHEALEAKQPGVWAESPEHFDESGARLEVEDTVLEDPADAGPPSTGGEAVAYPKWLYHVDGKRAITVESKAAHDAMVDKADWLESPDLSANLQANAASNQEPAGQALWETPVRDVVEMLKGAPLVTLEKTFALEEKNPGGGRRTLLRELSEMIEEAQEAARLKAEQASQAQQ